MSRPELKQDLRSFHAILPPGTNLIEDASSVPAAFRYWVGASSNRLMILPQDLRIGAAAFQIRDPNGGSKATSAALFKKMLQSSVEKGMTLKPLGLEIPRAAKWPIVDSDPEDFAVVFRAFTKKDLAFLVRRDHAEVDMVVKLPLNAPTTAGCDREFQMLKDLSVRGEKIAPIPLSSGRLSLDAKPGEQPFFAQSFVTGKMPDKMSFQRFFSFLERLRLDGQTVTLRGLADGLEGRIEGLNVSRESRACLHRLLGLVTDRTELPAAIGHGDCWRNNFLITPDDQFVALDWEFSHRHWLGFLDLIQVSFIEEYLKSRSTSFSLAFTGRKLANLQKYRQHFFPSKEPDLEQLLALHYCQNYIDRVEGHGDLGSPGLRQLDKILQSEWQTIGRKRRLPENQPEHGSKMKPADKADNEIVKIANLLSYTKSSNSAYSAKRYVGGYHTIRLKDVTIPGQRNPEKRLENVPFDFTDATVLDVGCNQGGMLFQISDKIRYGVGVDYDSRMVNAANRVRTYGNKDNLSFYVFDLEKENFEILKNFLPEEKIDIAFLLSVCMWLSNWKAVIDLVHSLSDNLLFESNGSPQQQQEQESYLRSCYAKVSLLRGSSPDDPEQKARKLYICRD